MTVPTEKEARKIKEPRGYEIYAESIMRKMKFKTLRDTEEILFYDKGVYKPGAESYIKEECQQIISKCKNSACNEVIGAIKRKTYELRENFDNDSNLINLEDGILDLTTEKLEPHSSNHLFRRQIPVKFDPKAEPVEYMNFLESSLTDEKNRTNAIEGFASILLSDLKLEKMIMNTGEGANGKSTNLAVFEKFFGANNVSHISIHDLIENRFAKSGLDGKLANIYADISRKEISELGAVKALISGDSIKVEKKHKEPFILKNKAKLIYSCNEPPEINESTYAVYRRILLIEWNKKFSHNGPDKIDPNLIQKLTTPEELSGILNLLIKTARKLKKNGNYTYAQNASELEQIWALKSDPIGKFIDMHVEFDSEAQIAKITLYNMYKDWCKENQVVVRSNKAFNNKIREIGAISTTARDGDQVQNVWKGIRIIENVSAVTTVTA